LDSSLPADVMPMISDNWRLHFKWNGKGPMPDAEKAKLDEVVAKAHEAGRVVRFWATPENPAVWQVLKAAGVDLINTDRLDELQAFLSDQPGS
jgi:glycerophosphoryl diester phosphodiesterase